MKFKERLPLKKEQIICTAQNPHEMTYSQWVEESRSSPYKVFMEDTDWGRNG